MFERERQPDGGSTSFTGSLWAQSLRSGFPAIAEDRTAEVIVVGGGLAGLLVATLLERSGADVLVVERHTIGGMATRNTTAKISALQGTVYREVRAKRGIEAAAAYGAAQLDAVDGMGRLIRELGIECSLTAAPAYTYATETDAAEQAREEFEAAEEAGLPVQWVTETDLPFEVRGAVRLDGQLHFNPGALCTGLAKRLGPARIAEDTVVLGIEENRDGCRIRLENGVSLSADNVVVATQAPIVDPALIANRCKPTQSYALSARLPGPVPEGMYLSCDRSVRSFRPARVENETIAVVGGEGHPTGDAAAAPARWDALAEWTVEAFGDAEVTHRWATHDLVPTDRVPFIGRLAPGATRRWVATGFAKWGMTNSYVAAKLIRESLRGASLAWTSTFDSTRIASTVNSELVSLGTKATGHLVVDRVTRRGEPRCTHQGCVLRRDVALDTWDCPCHGSRFEADGSVIQGPATEPLPG